LASLSQLQEVPSESMILLVGSPGSGKSSFCEQTVLQSLAIERPIIYLITECGPSKTEARLKERGLSEVQKGLLNFIDAYNETVGVSVPDRPDTAYADCNDLSSIDIAISKLQERIGRRGTLLVFDSLTSPYLFSGAEILRFMRQTLSRFAASGNAVLACIDEGCGKSEDLVAMMSLSDGVIRVETEEGKQFLNVMKHPKLKTARIEALLEPEPIGLEERVFDPDALARILRGEEAVLRREVGDFVNLFWPNLAHWSGMLWDPKRFPMMVYEMNKEDTPAMFRLMRENEALKRALFPWPKSLLLRFFPKSFNKVKDMNRLLKEIFGLEERLRSGTFEYPEDASKTDEHYVRIYESSECWRFKDVGATMSFYLSPFDSRRDKGI
jgi:KaiC/GvpD/RAD55 family RecA-like ATPase